MGLVHFFIDRPIFAGVVSIFIVILGGIAYLSLPAAQYPDVVPPTDRGPRFLSGRLAGGHRGNCGDTHRAGSKRRRKNALHVVANDD